jgi:uncharacterized protein (DUF1684 family)
MTELEEFRKGKDAFFKSHPQSPLMPEQKKKFTGLSYFSENPALRLEVTVEEFPNKETVVMQTSTGDVQKYQKYGKFKFRVEGQEAELTIYASPHGFFLPFVDSLAGTETYGAGRYLEPELMGVESFQWTSTSPTILTVPTMKTSRVRFLHVRTG